MSAKVAISGTGAKNSAGVKVLSLQTVPGRAAQSTQALCANAHGFEPRMRQYAVAPMKRKELERLCRTITRPAIDHPLAAR